MINIRVPDSTEHTLQPRITVIGVGGAGGNAVNNMIRANLEGVEFLVCNTDSQALAGSGADRRIQLGLNITRGLGAGSRPEVGRAAAEEALEELIGYLEGSNMVFITAGMGGGTGTGAAPVIARAAREHNILTVGVVTKPFQFEGAHRARIAEAGIQELQQFVDTLIIIPNQNLFRVASEKTTFADAFKMADEVLHSGVRGVTDLMVMPGLINLDFADIRTVMSEMGKAMMGTGEAEGPRRAIDAAEAAISNPLLDEVSLQGARAMLINITAGMDIALFEVDEAVNRVRAEVDPDANVIFGSTFDPTMDGRLRVSVVATGIDAQSAQHPVPNRQPSLDVIHGGGGSTPIRKIPAGLGAAAATAGTRPAALGGFGGGMAITMSATAEQLEPEMAQPVAEAIVEPAMNVESSVAPPTAATVVTTQVEAAPEITSVAATAPTAAPFIPPAPMDPGPRVPQSPIMQSDDQLRGEKKRGYSLFERVTGAARRAESAAQPVPPQTRVGPTFGPTLGATAAVAPAAPPVQNAQPRLGGLDGPRTKPVSSEDDLLEIPAFLRRQAN